MLLATDATVLPIVIIGAGLTGLSAAARLVTTGRPIVILGDPPPSFDLHAPSAPPVLALSETSIITLTTAGAWREIEISGRRLHYEAMQVWDGESMGHAHFRISDFGVPRLGCIVENKLVCAALGRALKSHQDINFQAYKSRLRFVRDSCCGPPVLVFDNGEELAASLVVGADGMNSGLRTCLAIPHHFTDYRQSAVVFLARSQRGHENTCWQVFQEGHIIAFLPTAKPDVGCVIWSCPCPAGETPATWDDKKLISGFNRFFATKLALSEVLTAPLSFPLHGLMAQRFVSGHCVLVGDAAHVVHPLAGQGGNLGLADVSDLLASIKSCQRTVFGSHWLSRYQRLAMGRNTAMKNALDTLKYVFSPQGFFPPPLRRLGMRVANCRPLLRICFKAAGGIRLGNSRHRQAPRTVRVANCRPLLRICFKAAGGIVPGS